MLLSSSPSRPRATPGVESDVNEIEQHALAAAAAKTAKERKAELTILYTALRDPVLRDIRGRVDSMATAEDLTQETWLRVARSIDQYSSRGGGFVPWLFTIARNLVIDHYRALGRRAQEVLSSTPVAAEVPCLEEGPQELAERSELAEALKSRLAQLPARQREVVYLRVCVGLSTAQTAAMLSSPLRKTSEGAVRVLLTRGLTKLAKILNDEKATMLADALLAPPGVAEDRVAATAITV